MFEKYRKFETTFAGRPLVVETGKTCELSNGSCWVRYGETVVMANVTASAKPREGVDFFPLSVDYEERMYAVGRIPGSFTKREGKPSEKAILTSRMVDRPIRPLFPKDMRNDVSVVMTVLAVDPDCSPEITGMLATSIAISISDIPWNGPIAGISVGLVDGEIVLNPTLEQRAHNDLRLTVAGTMEKIVMIEAGANEIPEQQMLDAILAGHAEIKKMVAFINDIKNEIGKPKFEFQSMELDHDLFAAIEAMVGEQVKVALDTNDKNERDARMQPIIDAVHEKYDPEYPEQGAMLDECLYKLQKKIVRNWLYEGKRVDGRGIDEIRPLAAEVGLLPRVHGSGLFTRGQTQVLTIATLGPLSDSQKIDGLDEETTKRYMHQYNFPSYSVGETKPSRGPGRRSLQASEVAKFEMILLTADIAARTPQIKFGEVPLRKWVHHSIVVELIRPILWLMPVLILLVLEPHMSGILLTTAIVGTILLLGGSGGIITWGCAGAALFLLETLLKHVDSIDYLQSRLDGWTQDLDRMTSQTKQSLYAIGSGGATGLGLGNSIEKQLWLPESTNDFIFSVVCEELGFVGAVIVIVLFVLFLVQGFWIAFHAENRFCTLVGIGIMAQIAWQVFCNIAVVTNTLPNTGISLPFFSSGGTSLILLLAEMGVMVNIGRNGERARLEREEAHAERERQRKAKTIVLDTARRAQTEQ